MLFNGRIRIDQMEPERSLAGIARRSGSKEMAFAAVIIILLVIGNLLAFFTHKSFEKKDLNYMPPTAIFFQRLLYQQQEFPLKHIYVSDQFALDIFSSSTFSSTETDANVNDSATITSTPNYTAIVGQLYGYPVRVKKEQKAVFSLQQGPEGMAIDPANGRLSWLPDAKQVGIHTVVVRALDPAGNGTEQTIQLYLSERAHFLGTDQSGRDIGACLILGSRWSLLPGLLAACVSIPLALLFGGMAGYYGGLTENVLTHGITLFSALPSLVLIFLTGAIFNFNIYPMMAVLGIIVFPRNALQIKNKVLTLKENQFIEAARELGLSDRQILLRDILWYNSRALVLTFIFQLMAFAILIEVTLSYLNLGIKEPFVSWGRMLFEHRHGLQGNKFWPLVVPAVAIFLSVAGFYLLADGINKYNKVRGV